MPSMSDLFRASAAMETPLEGFRRLRVGEVITLPQDGRVRVKLVNECRALCTPIKPEVIEFRDRFGHRQEFKVSPRPISIAPFIEAQKGGTK